MISGRLQKRILKEGNVRYDENVQKTMLVKSVFLESSARVNSIFHSSPLLARRVGCEDERRSACTSECFAECGTDLISLKFVRYYLYNFISSTYSSRHS